MEHAQAPATTNEIATKKENTNTKNYKMLEALVYVGDRGLNCFEAVSQFHDYVLRSSITLLERKYGIEISREWEQVPNYTGGTTTCKRYWLDKTNRAKAIAIIVETLKPSDA